MNEQEIQKFMLDCQVYKDKISKLEKITEVQETRLNELEKRNVKTDIQYEQIMNTLNKLINDTIPNLTREIQTIKNKPAERYNSIVTSIISAIAGGFGGFIISNILK